MIEIMLVLVFPVVAAALALKAGHVFYTLVSSSVSQTGLYVSMWFTLSIYFDLAVIDAVIQTRADRTIDIFQAALLATIWISVNFFPLFVLYIKAHIGKENYEKGHAPFRKEALSKWAFCLQGKDVLIIPDLESTTATAVMCDGTVKAICMDHPVGMYLHRMPESLRIIENEKELRDILV